MFLAILLLAARESEVLRLRIGDVDLEAGTVTLRRVKGWQATGGTSAVTVRPPAALLAELRAWIAQLRPGLPVEAPLLSCDKGQRWAPLRPHSLMGRPQWYRYDAGADYGIVWVRRGQTYDETGGVLTLALPADWRTRAEAQVVIPAALATIR